VQSEPGRWVEKGHRSPTFTGVERLGASRRGPMSLVLSMGYSKAMKTVPIIRSSCSASSNPTSRFPPRVNNQVDRM
jgi:hypothetical protein